VNQYQRLPSEVREEFQVLFNGTIGRAIQSLLPDLEEEHEVIKKVEKCHVWKVAFISK
jgi:hypothetical protein